MSAEVALRQLLDLTADERRQLEIQPDIAPFMIAPVLAMWSKVYGWNAQVLTCASSHLPIIVRQSVLGKIAFALPFGMYGFRLTETNHANFAAILDAIARQRFMQVNIVVTGQIGGLSTPPRFDCRQLTAQRIDLSGAVSFSENTERNVRKADFGKLEFRLLDPRQAQPAMKLLAEHVARTEEKRRIMPGAYRCLLNHTGDFIPGIVAGGAFAGDNLMAAQIFFVSARDAFYFDGFASAAGLNAGANFLIMNRMINWLRDRGIATLNLGATPSGDEGLARFKSGWGAQEIVYYELTVSALWKRWLDSLRGRG